MFFCKNTGYSRDTKLYMILLILMIAGWMIPAPAVGQKKNQKYVNYIEKYSKIAMKNQKDYKIPASIILAQGLLESGAGESALTKKSNNHFGIKCHSNWTGGRVYHDDDKKDDCFRKYKNADESFRDHALFLQRPNYSSLFTLDIHDYKGWARGLQRRGYATDKAYANKLIKLIEDYELYVYDKGGKNTSKNDKKDKNKTDDKKEQPAVADKGKGSSSPKELVKKSRTVYKTHGLLYVIAQQNDSFESVALDLDFKAKTLAKYNEVPEDFPLNKGDIVYLEKKKSKADVPFYEHVVQIGESMHGICQKYGVKLSNVYKLNRKNAEYVPLEGDVLRLR